jgi:hypothetical protein
VLRLTRGRKVRIGIGAAKKKKPRAGARGCEDAVPSSWAASGCWRCNRRKNETEDVKTPLQRPAAVQRVSSPGRSGRAVLVSRSVAPGRPFEQRWADTKERAPS